MANQNGQSRETDNIRVRKTKQKHNIICIGQHYTQTNTNKANKTCTLIQTKKNRTPFSCGNHNGDHNTDLRT